jgi:hypothetical protein
MTLMSLLRALSSTLAALALSANGASAENRPIHPATVAPKVTTNPPRPLTPGSGGRKHGGRQGVYIAIPLTTVTNTGYKTNHGTTGGAATGRHKKQ